MLLLVYQTLALWGRMTSSGSIVSKAPLGDGGGNDLERQLSFIFSYVCTTRKNTNTLLVRIHLVCIIYLHIIVKVFIFGIKLIDLFMFLDRIKFKFIKFYKRF